MVETLEDIANYFKFIEDSLGFSIKHKFTKIVLSAGSSESFRQNLNKKIR